MQRRFLLRVAGCQRKADRRRRDEERLSRIALLGSTPAARNVDTVCKLVRRATAHGGSYIDAVIRSIGVRRILSFH